jgi:hypothetical protein
LRFARRQWTSIHSRRKTTPALRIFRGKGRFLREETWIEFDSWHRREQGLFHIRLKENQIGGKSDVVERRALVAHEPQAHIEPGFVRGSQKNLGSHVLRRQRVRRIVQCQSVFVCRPAIGKAIGFCGIVTAANDRVRRLTCVVQSLRCCCPQRLSWGRNR